MKDGMHGGKVKTHNECQCCHLCRRRRWWSTRGHQRI